MINPKIQLRIGQMVSWGNPASPKVGIIKTVSQNGQIFFVMRTANRRHTDPLYETIERREILGVADVEV